MSHPRDWIEVRKEGLYCKPGDFYIDPMYAVDFALITHGHGDHARSGHKKILASPGTIAIMKTRYGENCAEHIQSSPYHETVTHKSVAITFFPAGHILGSSQIKLVYQNSSIIISGDYKRASDPTCEAFFVDHADVFITETTFGLPVFEHPPIQNEVQKLLRSLEANPDRCHLIGAYALGKCQRLIKECRLAGFAEPIYLHGAQIKLCDLYTTLGVELGPLLPVTNIPPAQLAGKMVICPPSALHDRWSRKFPNVLISMASGWMQIRARAKQKGIELPLIISDHADWHELTTTLHDVNAPEVWITHGNEEALVYYANQQGFKAQALALLRAEKSEDET